MVADLLLLDILLQSLKSSLSRRNHLHPKFSSPELKQTVAISLFYSFGLLKHPLGNSTVQFHSSCRAEPCRSLVLQGKKSLRDGSIKTHKHTTLHQLHNGFFASLESQLWQAAIPLPLAHDVLVRLRGEGISVRPPWDFSHRPSFHLLQRRLFFFSPEFPSHVHFIAALAFASASAFASALALAPVPARCFSTVEYIR